MEKVIKFRPLRKVKKTGKIVVASYSQWRKLASLNYSYPPVTVIIDQSYKEFTQSDHVFNHTGNQLFFYNYPPDEWEKQPFKLRGTDCDGIPVFSHLTAMSLANRKSIQDILKHDPLTVKMVSEWLGWLVWKLSNVNFESTN